MKIREKITCFPELVTEGQQNNLRGHVWNKHVAQTLQEDSSARLGTMSTDAIMCPPTSHDILIMHACASHWASSKVMLAARTKIVVWSRRATHTCEYAPPRSGCACCYYLSSAPRTCSVFTRAEQDMCACVRACVKKAGREETMVSYASRGRNDNSLFLRGR